MEHEKKTINFLPILLALVTAVALMVGVLTPPAEAPEPAITDPSTEFPTTGTEPPTEPPTEPSTEPPTEPPTEPSTEPPTEPPTEPSTEPPTEAPTEPAIPVNPYGPEDFEYDDDGYLTCTAGESILGIDVSYYQGEIDWARVKDAGVEFVMMRLGFRGYVKSTIVLDKRVEEYYRGATEAGLKVGVYFFSQAVSTEEAREEARFILDTVQGWTLEMPIVYDWEYVSEEARTANVDQRLLTDCTLAFCQEIRQAGYEPMIYFNPELARVLPCFEELTAYRWWLAMYDDEMDYPHRVDMWQYSNQGTVPGIAGNVDLNLWLPEA